MNNKHAFCSNEQPSIQGVVGQGPDWSQEKVTTKKEDIKKNTENGERGDNSRLHCDAGIVGEGG